MTFSFTLSKPLVDYGNIVREWSVDHVRPHARQADSDHQVPKNWKAILDTAPVGIGRSDILDGEPVPTFEEGKWVADLVRYESLFYGDTWVQEALGGSLGHLVVKAIGTPEQIDKWYWPIVKTGKATAFGLTEPSFGSDTSQVSTTATRDGDTWILNGSKIYCSKAADAEYTTIFATTDKSLGARGIAVFVVPAGTPGFVITKPNESKLGLRCWNTSALSLDDCVIPVENRLGWDGDAAALQPGGGQAAALAALNNNRPNVSAMAIGLAQASLDLTMVLLKERRWGFTVQRWAGIENEIETMNATLLRGRRVNRYAQFQIDSGRADRVAPAVAKVYSPQNADRIIRRCMQLLGPEGMSKELLLEKWYRDVKIMDIFEGTGQIHRITIARSLMGSTVR